MKARRLRPRSVFTRLPLTKTWPETARLRPPRRITRVRRPLPRLMQRRVVVIVAAPRPLGLAAKPGFCDGGAPAGLLNTAIPEGVVPICGPSLGSVSVAGAAGSAAIETGPASVLPRLLVFDVASTRRTVWPLAK